MSRENLNKKVLLTHSLFIVFLFLISLTHVFPTKNKIKNGDIKGLNIMTPSVADNPNLTPTPIESIETNIGGVVISPGKNSVFSENASSDQVEKNDSSINSIKTQIMIDPKEYFCDIKMVEAVSFSFVPENDKIYYTVISSKNPYYSFAVHILEDSIVNPDLKIVDFEIYVDKTFKQKTFVDDNGNNIVFRDRWVIAVILNQKVKNIDLVYSYFSERAVLIDQIEEANLLKINIFNPYSQPIDYDIGIKMTGFDDINSAKLKLPYSSTVREFNYKKGEKIYDNGIEISSKKNISPFTQYELFLSLPMEMKTCETGFVNIVYYALIGATTVFTLASLITVYKIYKE